MSLHEPQSDYVANETSIEMQTSASSVLGSPELSSQDRISSLAPIDKGRQAWTFVLCSFVLESIIWGFSFSFGVFQDFYLRTPPFNTASETTITSIGTITIGLQYIGLPFVISFCQKHPRWVRPMSWCVLAGSVGSLLISSFANAAWQLILLQGAIMGICGCLLYAPIVCYLSEWFIERRALAGSLIFGGSGIGGAFFPIVIQVLLDTTGFRWALRALAASIAVCGSVALLGIKPRLPIARVSGPSRPNQRIEGANQLDLTFLKNPLFITIALTTMAQALAYFPVSLYIPSYSTSIGLSTLNGTIALAVFNLARVIGQVIFGHICDKTPYTRVIILSGLLSALAAYLLLGFAHSLELIFAFVIVFGSVSGGFSSISPPASADIVGTGSQSSLVYGCLALCKGIAVIIGPIVSAQLHQKGSAAPSKYGGYGFTGVTLFVGSMMALTTLGGVAATVVKRMRVT